MSSLNKYYGPSGKQARIAVLRAIYGNRYPRECEGWNLWRNSLARDFGVDLSQCIAVQNEEIAKILEERYGA